MTFNALNCKKSLFAEILYFFQNSLNKGTAKYISRLKKKHKMTNISLGIVTDKRRILQ